MSMSLNDMVLHDLITLESDMIKAQKELKKLKRVNVIEGIFIVYLLCKVNEKGDEKVVHCENAEKKRKKWFEKGVKIGKIV